MKIVSCSPVIIAMLALHVSPTLELRAQPRRLLIGGAPGRCGPGSTGGGRRPLVAASVCPDNPPLHGPLKGAAAPPPTAPSFAL